MNFTECKHCKAVLTGGHTECDPCDITYLLRKRAEIRLANTDRKSVQEGKPDRAAQLMLDAADEIERLRDENYKGGKPE